VRSLIRRRAGAPRRDPAPSRWAYRLHRLWLRPAVRTFVSVGLPAFLVTFAAGVWLSDAGRRAALTETFADLRDEVKNRPEFLVTLLAVEGASPIVAETVRATIGVPLPQSSLDLDLDAARRRVEAIGAVKSAQLRVQPGGILEVTVTEREPAVVWRGPQGLILLDAEGHRIAALLARGERADLPLIAGEGADAAVPEALEIIVTAGPLLPRFRGLVRMGERRWDLVLDRDQRILLPAADPVRALERLLALDAAEGLLARDILAVDLRIAGRPALRLAPHALTELRRAQGLLPEEESEL
jgi:cell division protein FtsQ